MSKIKLGLEDKTVDEKITDGGTRGEAMENDANGEVQAAGTALLAENTTLNTKNNERTLLEEQVQGKTKELNTQQDVWDTSMNSAATEVMKQYPNNPAHWNSLGFEEAAKPGGPAIEMEQVEDFSLTRGDHSGTVDAHWHSMNGAKSYVLYLATTGGEGAQWMAQLPVTKSQATIDAVAAGFARGTEIWACVQAIGSGEGNVGPKSDPATVIVP